MQAGLVSVSSLYKHCGMSERGRTGRDAEERAVREGREGGQGREKHCNSCHTGFKQTKEVLLQFHQTPSLTEFKILL